MGNHCAVCGSADDGSGKNIDSYNGCPGCGELVCSRHGGMEDPFTPHSPGQHRADDDTTETWFLGKVRVQRNPPPEVANGAAADQGDVDNGVWD